MTLFRTCCETLQRAGGGEEGGGKEYEGEQ